MTTLAVLAPRAKSKSTDMILKEGRNFFSKVDFIPLEEVSIEVGEGAKLLFEGRSLLDYDYILPRIDSKRASFGYHVVKALDYFSVPHPYPAESLIKAHNKWATLFELSKFGIPVPKTAYTSSSKSAQKLIEDFSMPLILKLVSSYGGQGVLFLNDELSAKSAVKTLDILKQEIMIEEYIPNPGEDIRGFVVGGEVVASMKRVAKEGEKRANIKAGGRAEPCELTEEEKEICIKASEALRSKILAIDMIRGEEGPKVIEVNINPGLVGITKATGVNLAEHIVRFCRNEIKK